ncbi:MAG: ATP-binding protein [Clostridia bacterium]|nr:ATP-binding protein [Clostridia bacterium]
MKQRWKRGQFEFGVVYGTRRIGKTTLLQEFIKGKNAFYFQARKADEKDNLTAFSREFRKMQGALEHVTYNSFPDAFDSIVDFSKKQRLVLIIDEISCLCQKSKSLLSLLQFYIDGAFRDAYLMIILSGSNRPFMEEILMSPNSPLYQRATFQVHLEEMPFSEARQFVSDLPIDAQAQYLGLFGGHPYYLDMIDHAASFQENVRRLLYSKYGTLLDAPEKIMPAGVSDQNMYNSVILAVSRGMRFSKEIAEAVGVENNYVAKYLSSLIQMQILEKRESFIRNRKTNYYAVSDSLLRFWYRFIFDQRDVIQNGFGDVLFSEDQDGIEDFIARSFEDVALLWMEEQNRQGRLPVYYGTIRGYTARNSRLGRSVELDGLAEGLGKNRNHLLVAECKCRKTPFTMNMLSHLQESVSLFDAYDVIDYYLISKSGFTDEVAAISDPHIHRMTLHDLFQAS